MRPSSKGPSFLGPGSSLQNTLEPLDLSARRGEAGLTKVGMWESLAVRRRNSQLLLKHTGVPPDLLKRN